MGAAETACVGRLCKTAEERVVNEVRAMLEIYHSVEFGLSGGLAFEGELSSPKHAGIAGHPVFPGGC